MNPVITAKQAKQITGGRTPLVPVEYETAIKALVACTTLDEAKYWSDKSDALAAWAKIYRSDDVLLKAKQLKLHAYRRMGQLAKELRPGGVGHDGNKPGPKTLLMENGMSRMHADAARRLATIPEQTFEHIVRTRPVAPTTISRVLHKHPTFADFSGRMMTLRSVFRKHAPREMASLMQQTSPAIQESTRVLVRELSEWLDEFEQRLPKEKK